MHTVWQAGPMGSDRYTSESRSQSANMRTTFMKCPDVSPLHHRPCRMCGAATVVHADHKQDGWITHCAACRITSVQRASI